MTTLDLILRLTQVHILGIGVINARDCSLEEILVLIALLVENTMEEVLIIV